MDSRINALFRRYVLVLMLLEVYLTSVYLAPVYKNCADDLEGTKRLAELQEKESELLLESYARCGSYSDSNPDDVPDPTVSGMNFFNKLQDIYTKNELFYLHILKFEEYQAELLDERPFEELLLSVKARFAFLSARLKVIIETLEPNTPLPTKPGPLQITHEHDYDKKMYSWHVLNRLKSWLSRVVQVLENGKEVCQSS